LDLLVLDLHYLLGIGGDHLLLGSEIFLCLLQCNIQSLIQLLQLLPQLHVLRPQLHNHLAR
jgi:hypothetical protein